MKLCQVKPKLPYRLLGTGVRLNPDKIYWAIPADNIPKHEKELMYVLCSNTGAPSSDLDETSFLLSIDDVTIEVP
jgi:hypothetical protein